MKSKKNIFILIYILTPIICFSLGSFFSRLIVSAGKSFSEKVLLSQFSHSLFYFGAFLIFLIYALMEGYQLYSKDKNRYSKVRKRLFRLFCIAATVTLLFGTLYTFDTMKELNYFKYPKYRLVEDIKSFEIERTSINSKSSTHYYVSFGNVSMMEINHMVYDKIKYKLEEGEVLQENVVQIVPDGRKVEFEFLLNDKGIKIELLDVNYY